MQYTLKEAKDTPFKMSCKFRQWFLEYSFQKIKNGRTPTF